MWHNIFSAKFVYIIESFIIIYHYLIVNSFRSCRFHRLSQMFDYRVHVFAVSLPLLQTLLGIAFKLFILVLQIRLHSLGILELLSDLALPLSLLLFHLSFKLVLILFYRLFSEIVVICLSLINFRKFWFPSFFESLVIFLLLFFLSLSLFHLFF